jgi:N-acyl homoserine lactone hydrolase
MSGDPQPDMAVGTDAKPRGVIRVHAIRTGHASVHPHHIDASGSGPFRRMLPLVERGWLAPLPVLSWLVEHPDGLILVDAGADLAAASVGYFPRWHPFYRRAIRFSAGDDADVAGCLARQGIAPADIKTVVLSHLHWDHVGGLEPFRHARVLVTQNELDEARGLVGRARGYMPDHWPGWFDPEPVSFAHSPVGPFPESFDVTRSGDVQLLPTPGHTRGHMSVLVDGAECSWLLAGDASYTQDLMLEGVVDGVGSDTDAARRSQTLLSALVAGRPTVYLPSHDPEAERRLARREVAVSQAHLANPVSTRP